MVTLLLPLVLFFLILSGCENTDLPTAIEAGGEAIKAIRLSDQEVLELTEQSVRYLDGKQRMAPPGNKYILRLRRIAGKPGGAEKQSFNYGVYLSPEVNAFALADGTIRFSSGLMDRLDDGELRFVLGHEIGHLEKNHIRKKIRLAYAASAVRKGIASQKTAAGDMAHSLIGNLVEVLTNAQFSQLEEKEADDYGLAYLSREAYNCQDAVTALKKLASLGGPRSFLSSHPDPEKRAARLQAQLEGKSLSIEEKQQSLLSKARTYFDIWFP
jgi:metalloprotease